MRPARVDRGDKYSEGAALLWQRMHERKLSQPQVQKILKAASGIVSRWLYGEKRPGALWAAKIEDAFDIPASAWGHAPSRAVKRTGTEG